MATQENTNPNPSLLKDIIDDIFAWLPKEIIYDIILRLPVKTLLRLKSVSKSWLSLISDPDFVKTHLLKSTNDPHFTRCHLLVSSRRFFPNGDEPYSCARLDLESLSLYSLLNEPDTEIVEHKHPVLADHKVDRITSVVGSCNGLVCLASRFEIFDAVFLWNPSTGESRRLPNLIPESYCVRAYGFCYDESNDDFKVFSIICHHHPNHDLDIKVSIYSSKTDGSRIISDFPHAGSLWNMYEYDKGIFANEAMHWVFGPDWDSKVIVSLDIKTETFGEVLPPKYGESACRWMLGTFDKSLSFCKFESTHADFWVMKEYGVEESWTKMFTVPYQSTWFSRITMYPNMDRHYLASLKPINSEWRLYCDVDELIYTTIQFKGQRIQGIV